jgi:hypothetical protein
MGRSRGGLTSKIMVLVDSLGNLIDFRLMPGQRHDSRGVMALIEGLSFGALLGEGVRQRQAPREPGAAGREGGDPTAVAPTRSH